MLAYLRFELRRLLREPRLFLFSVATPVITYVVFTSVGMGDGKLEGVAPAAAVMIGLAGYGAMFGALSVGVTVAQERQLGWLRQLRITPLPPPRVVAVKALVSSVSAMPAVVAVGVAGFIQHGVRLGVDRWAAILVLMWLGTLPFALLGLAIGYGLAPQLAQPASFLSFFGLAVLGGLLLPAANLPAALQHLAHALPSYRFAELGWRSAAGVAPGAGGLAVLAAWTAAFGVLAAVAYRRSGGLR